MVFPDRKSSDDYEKRRSRGDNDFVTISSRPAAARRLPMSFAAAYSSRILLPLHWRNRGRVRRSPNAGLNSGSPGTRSNSEDAAQRLQACLKNAGMA
jgi:hypothetical protein